MKNKIVTEISYRVHVHKHYLLRFWEVLLVDRLGMAVTLDVLRGDMTDCTARELPTLNNNREEFTMPNIYRFNPCIFRAKKKQRNEQR